jgi:hypothetical protein
MYRGLPEFCYGTLMVTGETIIIKRGESGYYNSTRQFDADTLNSELGITKAQKEAMTAGSMFGWDVPASDPSLYDDDGKVIKEKLQKNY